MIEKLSEEMSDWAGLHGLIFREEKVLPPQTTHLRRGLGLGEHRTRLVVSGGGRRLIETGWPARRQERSTMNVCSGTLPGGLDGAVGHHVYTTDEGSGNDDGRWLSHVITVLFAELPSGARAAFNLEIKPAGGISAGLQIGKNEPDDPSDPLETVVLAPSGKLELGPQRLTTWPEEPAGRMDSIATGAVKKALAELPETTRVECESGRLCVWIPGYPATGQELDYLCKLASALAGGISETVAADSPLDPAVALPPVPEGGRQKWVNRGVDLVDWPNPPASVTSAQGAYRSVIEREATRTGWKIFGVASIAMFVISIILAACWLAGSFLWGTPTFGAIGACVIVLIGLRVATREGLKVGEEAMDDRANACSTPWGLEAFARGYAIHSGLTAEDPDELRHRLPLPVPGRPQMAWQGDLGHGVQGHLAVVIDATVTPAPPRFFLVAVVRAQVELQEPYEVTTAGDLSVVTIEVDRLNRAIGPLDELRATVTGASSRQA